MRSIVTLIALIALVIAILLTPESAQTAQICQSMRVKESRAWITTNGQLRSSTRLTTTTTRIRAVVTTYRSGQVWYRDSVTVQLVGDGGQIHLTSWEKLPIPFRNDRFTMVIQITDRQGCTVKRSLVARPS